MRCILTYLVCLKYVPQVCYYVIFSHSHYFGDLTHIGTDDLMAHNFILAMRRWKLAVGEENVKVIASSINILTLLSSFYAGRTIGQ
jgi:hypothetical protein